MKEPQNTLEQAPGNGISSHSNNNSMRDSKKSFTRDSTNYFAYFTTDPKHDVAYFTTDPENNFATHPRRQKRKQMSHSILIVCTKHAHFEVRRFALW